MALGRFELLEEEVRPTESKTPTRLLWPSKGGESRTIRSDLGWDLLPLSISNLAAIDLVRIAGGAYVCDRLTSRGNMFSREMTLTVSVRAVDVWTAELVAEIADLLHWLTGDIWHLTLVPDTGPSHTKESLFAPEASSVSLLSGGLDSFMGALHLLRDGRSQHFIGHKDASTAVKSAQKHVSAFLARSFPQQSTYSRYVFSQRARKKEASSRSRSFLFMALGIAAAVERGSSQLLIPENGYTSLNLPLHANRGGALSTRSTHPSTFRRMTDLLEASKIPVQVSNPFSSLTKGEIMALVAKDAPQNWLDAAANTLSCSKLDGARIQGGGGNPNLHCGLCMPCLVRRGTFIRAEQVDSTQYLAETLKGTARDHLIRRRQDDIDAVLYATSRPVDENLVDSGTWPPSYDLEAAVQLAQRGLDELALVQLP
jgi:7-cyano-7-deazaguanine synthase in queuosine biosynthesis